MGIEIQKLAALNIVTKENNKKENKKNIYEHENKKYLEEQLHTREK